MLKYLNVILYIKPEKRFLKVIHKFDALLSGDDEITKKVIDKAKNLKVISKSFQGSQTLYTLRSGKGVPLLALFPSHENFLVGDQVPVRFKVDHVVAYPL